MVREIIENILNQIENEYQILDKILININNKKKFYSNFYGNYDKHKDDIEKNNDNQCLAIITNNPDDINPNELKQKIREQYIKY
jgi:peptide methionine sulfoxide reductase MsrA